jgi:quercetin dioxygenase-like cupin family protein
VELAPLARLGEWGQAVRLEFGPGGVLPGHEAPSPQLFVCLGGSGWVRSGRDGGRFELVEGQAALFEPGEWHESGSDATMTVLVLEAGALEPAS